MKSLKYISITILCSVLFVNSSIADTGSTVDRDQINAIVLNLESALELRDFHEIKEHLEELLPIMKQDIKNNKKSLSALQKSDAPTLDVEHNATQFKRKNEIYEIVKNLMDVSPAAIRAKSGYVIDIVKEYRQLQEVG